MEQTQWFGLLTNVIVVSFQVWALFWVVRRLAAPLIRDILRRFNP